MDCTAQGNSKVLNHHKIVISIVQGGSKYSAQEGKLLHSPSPPVTFKLQIGKLWYVASGTHNSEKVHQQALFFFNSRGDWGLVIITELPEKILTAEPNIKNFNTRGHTQQQLKMRLQHEQHVVAREARRQSARKTAQVSSSIKTRRKKKFPDAYSTSASRVTITRQIGVARILSRAEERRVA